MIGPKQPCQPTPAVRLGSVSASLARRGCAFKLTTQRRMRPIAIYFLLTLTGQNLCTADVTKLSAAHSTRFHEVHATSNLPPAILALCADDSGRLAQPGQKWEATDYISDPSLPRKRLIWAATAGEYCVVHYERGGRAHSFHILVATLAKGDRSPTVAWRGVGERLKNYSAFLNALHSGKLDDTLDYAH